MGGEGQIESQRGGERHLFCPENKKHGRKVNFAATWWRRVDSNHRSETQQIYSLPPLATRELLQIYKAKSLFIELPQQISCERKTHTMELVDGLEPPTC